MKLCMGHSRIGTERVRSDAWNLSRDYTSVMGRDSSVGIATSYGMDGPGVESRWWRDFLHLSRPSVAPTQPSLQWVPGLSRG